MGPSPADCRPLQCTPGPQTPLPSARGGPGQGRLWGCWPPPAHSWPLHLPGVLCQCKEHPAAPGGQDVGDGGREPSQGPRAGVKVRMRVFVFLALRENRTKPQGRRTRSLTMAVPTEKAAIRQAMPRGRRRQQRQGLGGGGGGGDGRRARGCDHSWLGRCAPRGLRLPGLLGLRPRPASAPPRVGPAHAQPLASLRGGAGPAGARALVLLLLEAAGPAPWHPHSLSRPRPWA